jgi:hypothetical protein
MNQALTKLRKVKYLATMGLATFALSVGVATVGPAVKAAALNCRVMTANTVGYEGGMLYTQDYYVPYAGSNGCVDINVRNIQAKNELGQNVVGDNCATFTVQMFPTWGEPFYTKAKTVCSTGPNGAIVPLATLVRDGTKYRIWYNLEKEGRRHTFQIID